MGFIKWLISGLSTVNKRLLISHLLKDKKMTKEEKRTVAVDTLTALEDEKVLDEAVARVNDDTQKKILKTLLAVAVAGGKGYLVGGEAGAGLAAADTLLRELNNK